MKWIVPILLMCLFAGVSYSANSSLTQGLASWSESQALSRAAPTTSSTDGIALKGVVGYRLSVCAATSQAITGGSIIFWVQDADGLWGDNPTLKQTLTSTGQRCQVVGGDWEPLVRGGRFLPATSSVTVSGGTTVTVKLLEQIQ